MPDRNLIESGPLSGISKYIMPRPCLGQTVLWSYNPGSEKCPGIVTKVGHDSIAVSIHVDSLKDHLLKNGVRHETDPWLQRFPAHDGGCWRFTDWDKTIMEHLGISLMGRAHEGHLEE